MHRHHCSRRLCFGYVWLNRCVGDVTTQHKRAHYLSQLEAANNIAQAIGPFIGGVLSSISLSAAMSACCSLHSFIGGSLLVVM